MNNQITKKFDIVQNKDSMTIYFSEKQENYIILLSVVIGNAKGNFFVPYNYHKFILLSSGLHFIHKNKYLSFKL